LATKLFCQRELEFAAPQNLLGIELRFHFLFKDFDLGARGRTGII